MPILEDAIFEKIGVLKKMVTRLPFFEGKNQMRSTGTYNSI